ncbi:Vacuolar protein sorting-associated protein 4B [Zootermopsis nevadensis]|uniref:Vacuolar protein sorting-associated protein 4B n=1 Tax=Zootermopsis nevadensis TaxID=136037 RepID=A0A067QIA5_ZOONE|nr:Vacuolar protein sorting-associated protein 4B [Zootermopsis nevadensis]
MAEETPLQKARRCAREARQKCTEAKRLYEDAIQCLLDSKKYEAQGARPKEGNRTQRNKRLDGAAKLKAGESCSKNNYEKKLQTELEKAIMVEKPCVKGSDVAGVEGAKKVSKQSVIFPIKFPHVFPGKRKPSKGILGFGVRL